MNLNLTEISSLKMRLIKYKDSLNYISNELNKLKTLTLKPQANITENNYYLLVTKFGNKEKDIRDISVDLRESPADLEGDTELYDWYDFTIPDDANIVSGACRDVAADF